MKIRHFEDTDTLLIELKLGSVAEIRDLGACRAWGTSAAVWPQRSIFRRFFAP